MDQLAAELGTRPAIPSLGIGLNYQETLRPFIDRSAAAFDFLEVVPDIVWTDRGPGGHPRYVDDPDAVAFLERVRSRMPVVAHSIGLSIGSAHNLRREHIDQIARWYEWLRFPWHSDHFAYNLAEHASGEIMVGVPLPLPLDRETVDLVAARVGEVQARVPVPFLLENNVYYFEFPDQELEETEFLNLLTERSGCRLLLDLHNLYVNHRNHGIDPIAYLSRLHLDQVVEIHLAGGVEYGGFYLDGHSGPVPGPVWELADWVVPRCPNLGGVVFELLGSWLPKMGEGRLADDLGRMRELWQRRQPSLAGRSS